MTIDPVAPSGPNLVRFATPYLEVETQSISSLERAIRRELAQASHAARRRGLLGWSGETASETRHTYSVSTPPHVSVSRR